MSEIKTLTKVNSSMLYAVGYDPKSEVLEVVFNSGKIWRYYDVPLNVYEGLLKTRSVGSYMNSYVIDCYEDEPL
ncbi:MAG: KTSC domain-containing protein [Opitutaceae bacterium]